MKLEITKSDITEYPSLQEDIYIDASVMQIADIIPRIEEKLNLGYNFLMLDFTLTDLKRMLGFKVNDNSKINVKKLFDLKQQNENHFIVVSAPLIEGDKIKKILRFVQDCPNSIILWTSNKKMAEEAKEFGLKYEYFIPEKREKERRIGTFYQARLFDGSLTIFNINAFGNIRRDNLIWIIRGEEIIQEAHGAKVELGDQVLVCCKQIDANDNLYISFVAYVIIAIADIENVEVAYNHRFYDCSEPYTLKNGLYVRFLHYFIKKFQLDTLLPKRLTQEQKRKLLHPD